MANLIGSGINQISVNGMLGNLAFQDKAYVNVDAIGIGTTFVDSGTVGQVLQVSGGAYVSGNLGIGTTNPTSKLHVVGDARITGVVTATTFIGALTGTATSTTNIPNLTGAITSVNTTTSLGSFTSSQLATALTDETGSGSAVFATSPTLVTPVLGAASATSIVVSSGSTFTNGPILVGSATSTGTASQRLQVTGGAYVSGNLGIGTTNPTQSLHVQGNARVTGAVFASDVNGISTSGTSGQVLQSTGIGISWVTSGGGASLTNDTTTNATYYPTFSSAISGTYSTAYVSNTKCTFNPSTGTLSATVFTSLSDETQKTDIQPIENAISIVKQLQGVKYKWINDHSQPSIGVIAQEVEKVLPEVVSTNDNGLKSVSYGNIIGVLIEAIKEQQVCIEELKKKLNS